MHAMARFVLEQISHFLDYTNGRDLIDILTQRGSDLSDVRVSPDARHIHVILRKPTAGLVTFDKYERPQLALSQKQKQDYLLCLNRTVPIVDVLYLAQSSNDTVAVIYENGKAEFWRFQEAIPGWHLQQTSDLCNSPRAKVVSVCSCVNSILWCEERPPSESSPVLSSSRNKLKYCVCRRDFELQEGGVVLRGVRIALHNNPKFTVISSGEHAYLLPDIKTKPLAVINKVILCWSPSHDTLRLSTTCKTAPLKEDTLSTKESDFKRLLTDCLAFLSILDLPEICFYSSSGCGGLLLLLGSGWVCLLQKDGILRQVYKLENNFVHTFGSHTSLCMYQETLALLTEQSLHLIDINCGTERGKIKVKKAGLLFRNQIEKCTPQFVSEEGIFTVQQETETKDIHSKLKSCGSNKVENFQSGELLIEAVFEEACKYYQQRSLSSTRLTVDALKKGGKFQAPISLATILRTYLSTGGGHSGAQNGVHNGGDAVAGQDKLMSSLEPELKALVALEDVKGRLVKANVKDVEALCENLVEKEVSRLLSSAEIDKDSLLYLNSIFKLFPCQAWRSVQATLQFHYNSDGLSSSSPHDIWKTVLSPAPSSPVGKHCTNGEQKHNLNTNHITNAKVKASRVPAVLPVFELLCMSVYQFEPNRLPSFLELSQKQQGATGLGLSLASSSWGFPSGRGAESSDKNVPLYKRALSVVSSCSSDREQNQDLQVELLLVSGRPNAILQALRILMGRQQWDRVTQVAEKFCKQSPLLNKEIFSTLLCEVAQHRELDPYLELLWSLCPEDITVTHILNMVLKNLPPSKANSSSSFPLSTSASSSPAPFADPQSSQLTIGLLKPLLRKVLERETKSNQGYVDILQSPSYPPPAPPRQPVERRRTGTSDSTESDQAITSAGLSEQHEPPSSQTNVHKAGIMTLPAKLT
ncbi:BLOC-2 complex member HPS6 [Eucyclogobius newberryi]|uniref:BLOC-2 complex member HPS6 n=1 Tax=Eucyclogobius newberryi TaxID=166745 RepID=UPI003B5D05F6